MLLRKIDYANDRNVFTEAGIAYLPVYYVMFLWMLLRIHERVVFLHCETQIGFGMDWLRFKLKTYQ